MLQMGACLVTVTAMLAALGGAGGSMVENPSGEKDLSAKDPAPTLKLTDPAPKLKASKWLQGEEVAKFEPGHVYVVEFWTTWCGPCHLFMPHLAELQAKYKDKGLTVIGYSAQDDINTEEKVAAFVKKRGPKLAYTFAFSEDRATYDAWMKAAGQAGIPCTFVVDKAGRIAYIGHPLCLGVVIPKVVAGVKAEEIRDELAKIHEDMPAVGRAVNSNDAKASLKALEEFETKYPPLANNPNWLRQRIRSLCKVGNLADVKRLADAAEAQATKYGDSLQLWMVSTALMDESRNDKELLALAVKAAAAMVEKAGDNDPRALIHVATAYNAAGEKSKAKEFSRKALEAAASEPAALREAIEKQAKTLADELENEKK
jgi:thiol-disulfide isomerase/thioredoxin